MHMACIGEYRLYFYTHYKIYSLFALKISKIVKQPLRKDLEPVAASFIVKELIESHFDPNWHFHPHYQLFLVEEGTGTRFIGDSIKPFGPGDLVFLGPNLPHLWRSDQAYFTQQPAPKKSSLTTRGIVVYFQEDFLGHDFFDKQELVPLRQLLNHARQGLEWTGHTLKAHRNRLKKSGLSIGWF